MATDPTVSESVRLSAIKDALDRGGVSAKSAVEVEVGPPKPWEEIMGELTEIESGSREAYRRRSHGIPDEFDLNHIRSLAERPPGLPAAQSEPIEAEIVGYKGHRRVQQQHADGE